MSAERDHGLWREYKPPGPKALGWLMSDAPIAMIIGPYGSAKTTTGAEKCIRVTCQQHPSVKDGVRRALITAVRPNYRRMDDTLVASFKDFFGKDGGWDGPANGPQNFFLRWQERGDWCELIVWFRAPGEMTIKSFVRGFQPTAWYLNEFDELPRGAISQMKSRAGRYKLKEKPVDLPPVRYCKVFGDANMPDLDNWAHDILLKQPDPDVEVFLQPSGLSPHAENIAALRRIDPHYYETMAADYRRDGQEWAVKRFIENKAGYTPDGEPVYPTFDSDRHVGADTLEPDPMRQLVVGVDQGGQAAAIVTQKTTNRAVLVLDEIVLPEGAFFGGEEFGRLVAQRLADRFPRFMRKGGVRFEIDPAGEQRHSGTKENEARTWTLDFIDGFEAESGLECDWMSAITNSISRRKAAVRKLLGTDPASGRQLMIVHPRCRVILRGFAGGYRHMQKQGRPGEYHSDPEKNYFANPHDALQYAALDHLPELAAGDIDKNDPHAEEIAKILMPQAREWDDGQPTEQLF